MFGRLRCHFCGTRSRYPRGTTEFQCSACDALNFFDSNGEVVEPPSRVTNPPQPTQQRATSPFRAISRPSSQEEEDPIFCQRCLKNQRMYLDALNSYLPDENNPLYQEYMDKLPQKKAQLEMKYPQVCKACAPKVQERIYQADYYGMSQQAAAAMSKTRARRGRSDIEQRDDWRKWWTRLLLGMLRLVVYGSLLVQALWHAYGICMYRFGATTPGELDTIPFVFEPSRKDCFQQALHLRFDKVCFNLLGEAVSKALAASLLLLWYNPGLKAWYHHSHRIEGIRGQDQYFRLQVFMFIVRAVAWYNFRDSEILSKLSQQQLLASHGFMILFLLLAQWNSESGLVAERWRIRGKIMPRPSEEDVFSQSAGPADEQYPSQASSTHPLRLFARDPKPFPIENLAGPSRLSRDHAKIDMTGMPSPPGSDSASEDDNDNVDAMDIDTPPVRTAGMPGVPNDRTFRSKASSANHPPARSLYNHGTTQPSGWGAMLGEVFGMQDQMRVDEERKRQELEERAKLRFQPPQTEQSPFHGSLPPAPMSMERRLRNPPTQLQFKQTPASKQQDFMTQMRNSFEKGRTFSHPNEKRSGLNLSAPPAYHDDDDEEFSPAKSRTRGSLELRPGSWHLPGDGQQTTGLEELLGGKSFAIADEQPPASALPSPIGRPRGFSWTWPLLIGVLTILFAALNVRAIRRPVSLWLLGKLEEMGV